MAFIWIIPAVLLIGTFRSSRGTREQLFWKWFQENEAKLFNFESDQERIFHQLLAQLHKVNPSLTFEFGPKTNGKREFIISADGIKTAFPSVEALYAAAPNLPRWQFIKFRPRRAPFDISYGDVLIKADLVRVSLEAAGSKANLIIYLPGYSDSERRNYMAAAFLFLDQALGEYDVETYIDQIAVKATDEAPHSSYSLQQLPSAFDRLLRKQ